MLGKLIKYELMAEARKYGVIFIALITTAVCFLLFDKGLSKLGDFAVITLFSSFLMVAFVMLCFIAFAMIYVFSVIRFYKNLYRDEGYLMHTLPVPAWQHIVTKLIAAYVWLIATVAVVVVSICIAVADVSWIGKIAEGYTEFINQMSQYDSFSATFFNGFGWYMLVALVVSPLLTLLFVYFCISIGSLFNTHKILMSVVAFIGVSVVSQIISTIAMVCVGFASYTTLESIEDINAAIKMYDGLVLSTGIISLVLYTAMAYFTNHIMSKKLNLE